MAENEGKMMKILRRIFYCILFFQLILLGVSFLTFEIKDMTEAVGTIHSFNENWTLVREDGQEEKIQSLPYSGKSEKNEIIIVKNKIPKEYWGESIAFLSADKTVHITIDGNDVYDFGTKDERWFGNTPGSIVNFVDIPESLSEGEIVVEMQSPYKNYAASLNEIEIGKHNTLVLNLLRKNLFNLCCAVIMLFSGIALAFLAFIQSYSHQKTQGMEFLSMLCISGAFYYAIETKTLSIFWGNQTVMSILVFLILMNMPMTMALYYEKSRPDTFDKKFHILIYLSCTNILIQLILQLFDVVDFMDMVFISHALILVTAVMVLWRFLCSYKKTNDITMIPEFFTLFCMGAGFVIDILRNYLKKSGDLGEFSRYGTTLFCLGMMITNIVRLARSVSKNVEEKENLLKHDIEMAEEQNELLRIANAEAEEAMAIAESANAAKSNFLANMSHEIRTPINAMLGMDLMILRESKEQKILDYAKDIQSAGRSLLSLVNDILDFSKIESGKMEILPVEYDVASLINDCYNMIAMRINEKGLQFQIYNDELLPARLYGDEVRIRQIMINLLNNAVKYTDKGKISLDITWKPGRQEEEIVLCISVKDTGQGISEENQEKLFQSFQRIDEKKNRNIEGTGLGLSITKQLVELMNGNIGVESEFGSGSVFYVQIPQRVVTKEYLGNFNNRIKTDTSIDIEEFRAPEACILVVDDMEMNLKVMESLLERTKVQVDTALSGAECLEMLERKQYHLIFLDHMMPEMDGIETLHKIRNLKDNKNADTPIIMLTANAILGAKEDYIRNGFSDYLSKPVHTEELEKKMKKYIPKELLITVSKEEIRERQNARMQDKMISVAKKTGNRTRDLVNRKISETMRDKASEESDFLQSLDFLDTEVGLRYCSGNEEFYRIILRKYLETSKYVEIKEAYQTENLQDYYEQIQSMRGISMAVGAVKLSQLAERLAAAAKEQDMEYIHAHHENMLVLYGETLQKIRKVVKGIE